MIQGECLCVWGGGDVVASTQSPTLEPSMEQHAIWKFLHFINEFVLCTSILWLCFEVYMWNKNKNKIIINLVIIRSWSSSKIFKDIWWSVNIFSLLMWFKMISPSCILHAKQVAPIRIYIYLSVYVWIYIYIYMYVICWFYKYCKEKSLFRHFSN